MAFLTPRAAACLLVALAPSAMAARMAEVATHSMSRQHVHEREAVAAERVAAVFREAFSLESASSTCPYGTKAESYVGGTEPFNCHYHLPADQGRGRTCPKLQQGRLKVARKFIAAQYSAFVQEAGSFPLAPLFDKSERIIGDESYENLVKYHIDGLMNPAIVGIEDKILLKTLADSLDIPSTEMYYGVHVSEFDSTVFTETMEKLCAQGVDGMIFKATHLAWSTGMKIVRGWQETCKQRDTLEGNVTQLAAFVQDNILSVHPRESDAHLNYLEPGFTVEELFKTGGASVQPLEAKAQVIWGKVHQIFFIGQDPRGCQVGAGSWVIYGDRSGWDLGGMMGTIPKDSINQVFMGKVFDKVVKYAEAFAKGIGADYTRADFFIGGLDTEGEPIIKLNEGETVSGYKHAHERFGIGSVWRDGYVLRENGIEMTPEKWDDYMDHTQGERDANELDLL